MKHCSKAQVRNERCRHKSHAAERVNLDAKAGLENRCPVLGRFAVDLEDVRTRSSEKCLPSCFRRTHPCQSSCPFGFFDCALQERLVNRSMHKSDLVAAEDSLLCLPLVCFCWDLRSLCQSDGLPDHRLVAA